MKGNPLCAMTQELLPSYAEGTAGAEAAEAVRSHLERCAGCKRIYEAMIGIRNRAEEEEPIPVEAFVRKNRRRKTLILTAAAFSAVLLFIGVMSLITALSGGADTWIVEDGAEMNAVLQKGNDPGSRTAVNVRFTARYRAFRLPWEKPDRVLVTELFVTTEDGEELLAYAPSGRWISMPLPVRNESGITAPLSALNTRDPAEQDVAGTLYSTDGMESFLFLFGDYALFWPADRTEDADGLLARMEDWYGRGEKRRAVFREMEGWFDALKGGG